MQTIVDDCYRLFVADVATGRSVPPATVKSPEWGEGAVLTAKDAKKAGMVDSIATFSETLARLAGAKSTGARAEAIVTGHEPECNEQCDPERGLHYLMADDGEFASSTEQATDGGEALPVAAAAKADIEMETRQRRWRLHR